MTPTNDAACLSTLTQPCFLEPSSSGVRAVRSFPSDLAVDLPAQPLRIQPLPPIFQALQEAGSLSDLDEVAVGVADVAADLRSPVYGRG